MEKKEYKYNFKEFVINVLNEIAIESDKKITFNKQISYKSIHRNFDAIAEDGFFEFDGPVFIKIKENLKNENGLKNYYDLINNIVNSNFTFVIITDIYYELDKKSKIGINIFDKYKIDEWKINYPFEFYLSLNKSNLKKFDILFNSDFFDKKNKKIIKYLQKTIKNDNFALVLGAGVSLDPGAQSWKKLIEEYTNAIKYKNSIENVENVIKKIGDSQLTVAQLCKDLLTENDYFRILHDCLYSKDKPIDSGFAIYKIAQIVDSCQKNKNFRILTYNYDDYLEKYLDRLKVNYNSLYVGNCKINRKVSIYHVHGFLPKLHYKTYLSSINKKSIYLTEEDYNDLYNNPYSWQISSQLSFFRENICLFIGCSLTDPNIRRLLEIAKKDDYLYHYAFFSKDDMIQNDLLKISYHFYRLGIHIIWIDDYDQLPKILEQILNNK